MRVLVCGSRDWTDSRFLWAALDETDEVRGPISVVVEGEASGADTIARQWAEQRGVDVDPFPADWRRYHKAAGPIRNQAMLDSGADLVVAFHPDLATSRGTADMVRRARRAGVETIVYTGKETA